MRNDINLHGLNESDMDSPAKKTEKALRAERFSSILLRHKLPRHGAASIIADKLGVTPATVSAWIRGSMPRDPVLLFLFCDMFEVCPYYWTTGVARPTEQIDASRLIIADRDLSLAITKLNTEVNPRQRLVLLADVYNNRQRGLDRLTQLAYFFDESSEP